MLVSPSVKVTGTAYVGMGNHGDGLSTLGGAVEIVLQNGGDALVGERTDRKGAPRNRLGACRIKAAEQAQHAETGAKALLGMRTVGEHGEHQRFGVDADRARPALEARRRPFGVATMCARHVFGIGVVPTAAIAALMRGDALGAIKHLHGAAGDAQINLSADQRMRHRVIEAIDLDVIVDPDAGETPFCKLVSGRRQGPQRFPLDAGEQIAAADPEPPHEVTVDAIERGCNREIGFGEREECLVAQPPENVGLGEPHAGFDFRLVESRQMQVVWEQRRGKKSVSHTPSILSAATRSKWSADAAIGARTGSFIWTGLVDFAGLLRLGPILSQRTSSD